jgi:4-hydroxyphenylacetate 3-monooxygenase
MTEAYPAVRAIVEKVIASGLIYLPSHARDFKNPKIDKYLARYVRGSNDIDYKERIKIMKLLWDAIGSEFGARHELYEMDYSGSHELVRLFPIQQAQASGTLGEMEASSSVAWRTMTKTVGGTWPTMTGVPFLL